MNSASSRFSHRLARGGESPALMGQTLRKWLPSTRTVCVETQEAAGSREPGESKVSLHAAPRRRAEGCRGSACGGGGRWGHAGAPQPPRAGPLRSLARGPRLGCGCLLAPLGLHCPFPSTASGPAPQLARPAHSSPWDSPRGLLAPQGAHCCYSLLSSMRAVRPGRC